MQQKPQPGSTKAFLLEWVESGTPTVAAWQRFFGVTPTGPTNWFWHAIFTFGASLGNEIFFILFLPGVAWVWDWYTFRRTILLWCMQYYVGHYWKDTACLPRPPTITSSKNAAHGVVRLEKHYEWEYGMPSTHSMNALSMPTLIFLTAHNRMKIFWNETDVSAEANTTLLLICVFWMLSSTMSRLYMGVHSPADMFAGLGLGIAAVMAQIVVGESLDNWILHGTHVEIVLVGVCFVLAYLYPRPSAPLWVPTPGDTTLILAVSAGVFSGIHQLTAAHTGADIPIEKHLTWESVGYGTLGCVLGYAILMATRAICKAVGTAALDKLLPPRYGPASDHSIQPNRDAERWADELEAAKRLTKELSPLPSPDMSEDPQMPSKSPETVPEDHHFKPDTTPKHPETTANNTNNTNNNGDVLIPPGRRYEIELPVKILAYGMVGYNATYVVPHVLDALGLIDFGLHA